MLNMWVMFMAPLMQMGQVLAEESFTPWKPAMVAEFEDADEARATEVCFSGKTDLA